MSPGDAVADEGNVHHQFSFTQLGVRVPAIVISPLVPRNIVDHTVYDHTSLLATLQDWFSLPALTNRDAMANRFTHLLSLKVPRDDAPTRLPEPAVSGFRCKGDSEARAAASRKPPQPPERDDRPIEPVLQGFVHVAFLRDYRRANPLARSAILRRYLSVRTRSEALAYIQEVARKRPKPRRRFKRRRPRGDTR
jgi:phospholipase C